MWISCTSHAICLIRSECGGSVDWNDGRIFATSKGIKSPSATNLKYNRYTLILHIAIGNKITNEYDMNLPAVSICIFCFFFSLPWKKIPKEKYRVCVLCGAAGLCREENIINCGPFHPFRIIKKNRTNFIDTSSECAYDIRNWSSAKWVIVAFVLRVLLSPTTFANTNKSNTQKSAIEYNNNNKNQQKRQEKWQ